MTAYKITVERVDIGNTANNFKVPVYYDITDELPFTIVMPDSDADGCRIRTLKCFLGIAFKKQIMTLDPSPLTNASAKDDIELRYGNLFGFS